MGKKRITIMGVPLSRLVGYIIINLSIFSFLPYTPAAQVLLGISLAITAVDITFHTLQEFARTVIGVGQDKEKKEAEKIDNNNKKDKNKEKDKEREDPTRGMIDNTKAREEYMREKSDTRAKKEEIVLNCQKAMAKPGADKNALGISALIELCALCHCTGQSFDVPLSSGKLLQFSSRGDNESIEIKVGIPVIDKNGKSAYKYENAAIIPAKSWTNGHNPRMEQRRQLIEKNIKEYLENVTKYREIIKELNDPAHPVKGLKRITLINEKEKCEKVLKGISFKSVENLFNPEYPGNNETFGDVVAYDSVSQGKLGTFAKNEDLTSFDPGKICLDNGFVAYAPPVPGDYNLKEGERLLYKYVVMPSEKNNGHEKVDDSIREYDVYKQTIYQDKDGAMRVESNSVIMTGTIPAVIATLGNTPAAAKWIPFGEYGKDENNHAAIDSKMDAEIFSRNYDPIVNGVDLGYGVMDKYYTTPGMAMYLLEKNNGCSREDATGIITKELNYNSGLFVSTPAASLLKEIEAQRGKEIYAYGEHSGGVDMLSGDTKAVDIPQIDYPDHTQEIMTAEKLGSMKQIRKAAEKDKISNKDEYVK